MLGGRPPTRVLREVVEPRNYAALVRMTRVAAEPRELARRYFLGGGEYPYDCVLRTPCGPVTARLYSHHDVWTVVEIFCREDYSVGSSVRVVVDVGSNIGLSALYFLTRNRSCRSYLYEPEPRNVARLKANLAPFADRWQLREVAVGTQDGVVAFGREPTGRYGAVGAQTGDVIGVPCFEVNRLLEDVLEREREVDVLKIDTEGLEVRTVAAIRADLLERIALIYFESKDRARLHSGRFAFSFANETVRLCRRDALTHP